MNIELEIFNQYCDLMMCWDKARILHYLEDKYYRQYKFTYKQIEEIINKYEYKL